MFLTGCRSQRNWRDGRPGWSSLLWRAQKSKPGPRNASRGRKLYALRKQVPEPVFGIIKSVLGFRQFLLRGLDRVQGEWSLVTMAWNMKRLFVLCPAG